MSFEGSPQTLTTVNSGPCSVLSRSRNSHQHNLSRQGIRKQVHHSRPKSKFCFEGMNYFGRTLDPVCLVYSATEWVCELLTAPMHVGCCTNPIRENDPLSQCASKSAIACGGTSLGPRTVRGQHPRSPEKPVGAHWTERRHGEHENGIRLSSNSQI